MFIHETSFFLEKKKIASRDSWIETFFSETNSEKFPKKDVIAIQNNLVTIL